MTRSTALLLRFVQLFVGLFLYGFATAMMVRAVIGVSSWTVLTEGLENVVPWSFGVVTVVSSGVILLLWIPLRQRPGIGTLLNALLIGPAADFGLWVLPSPSSLVVQVLVFVGGMLLLGIATGCYIGARFGAGARDGLMVGLHERTGWPIWLTRTLIEVTVVVVGWLLGGDVGVGTVAAAFLIGPIVGWLMPWFARFPWSPGPTTGTAAPADAAADGRSTPTDGLEAHPASS
ncbi:YczE/YyaS/YitT family protein [Curtobacterium sp. RRHDQ10]|uniref:membrane protein YczE n=1 Tax=Curtobacterium phyllosphaerae TaxID=3413379 RepID=UPI003BF0B3C5